MRTRGKHYLIRATTIDDLKERPVFLDGKGGRTSRVHAKHFSLREAMHAKRLLRREPWVATIHVVPA